LFRLGDVYSNLKDVFVRLSRFSKLSLLLNDPLGVQETNDLWMYELSCTWILKNTLFEKTRYKIFYH